MPSGRGEKEEVSHMYEYDPSNPSNVPYNSPGAPFSELDDPQFWTGIAARTGIPPMQYMQPILYVQVEEVRDIGPQTPLPLLPAPGGAPPPTYSLPPTLARRYPVPYQPPMMQYEPQRWVYPVPVQQPPARQAKTRSSSILYLVLFGALLAILLPAILARPAPTRTLTRIDQWDVSQYNSPQDAKTWGPSACSAAALTEVLNYEGDKTYRIADVLAVEIRLGEITPQLGLLHGATSISRTVAHFGMKSTALSSPTLDEIIAQANKGTPIIVNFPPATWSGGHFLLVHGGDATTVDLVDSSSLNKKVMSRQEFLSYWRGFAVVVEPA